MILTSSPEVVPQLQLHGPHSSLASAASTGLLQHNKLLLIELIKAGCEPASCSAIPLSYQGSPLFIHNRYSAPATHSTSYDPLCAVVIFANVYSTGFVLKHVFCHGQHGEEQEGHHRTGLSPESQCRAHFCIVKQQYNYYNDVEVLNN